MADAEKLFQRIQQLLKEGDNAAPPSSADATSLTLRNGPDASQSTTFVEFSGSSDIAESFHELVRIKFPANGTQGFDDLDSYAEGLAAYGHICQLKYDELKQTAKHISLGLVPFSTEPYSPTKEQELRAERDLWSLLTMAAHEDVLGDISEEEEASRLATALDSLPIDASIADYIQVAYEVDWRYRKAEVLKSWLERAALDQVTHLPARGHIPWTDTQHFLLHAPPALRKSKTPLSSLHPDAQIVDGKVLPLIGIDQREQEALHLHLFHLLRAGQILQAQQVAAEHQVYWLAALLRGVTYHTYPPESALQGNDRVGNLRQPLFHRTCWQYVDRLSRQTDNWQLPSAAAASASSHSASYFEEEKGGDGGGQEEYSRIEAFRPAGSSSSSHSHGFDAFPGALPSLSASPTTGHLEISLMACLADHVPRLIQSSLLPSWQDKAWIYLKAYHCRCTQAIVQCYRLHKAHHSLYIPGCDASTIACGEDMTRRLDDVLGDFSVTDLATSLEKHISVPRSPHRLLSLLASLQSAVLCGGETLMAFFQKQIPVYLQQDLRREEEGEEVGEEDVAVWRLLVHVMLALRSWPQPPSSLKSGCAAVVPTSLWWRALQRYAHVLGQTRRYSLAAVYLAYLPPVYRVQAAVPLLALVQTRREEADVRQDVVRRLEETVSDAVDREEEQREVVRRLLAHLDSEDYKRGGGEEAGVEGLHWLLLATSLPPEDIAEHLHRAILHRVVSSSSSSSAQVLTCPWPKEILTRFLPAHVHEAVARRLLFLAEEQGGRGEEDKAEDMEGRQARRAFLGWTAVKLSWWQELVAVQQAWRDYGDCAQAVAHTLAVHLTPSPTSVLRREHAAEAVLRAVTQLVRFRPAPLSEGVLASVGEVAGCRSLWIRSRQAGRQYVKSLLRGVLACEAEASTTMCGKEEEEEEEEEEAVAEERLRARDAMGEMVNTMRGILQADWAVAGAGGEDEAERAEESIDLDEVWRLLSAVEASLSSSTGAATARGGGGRAVSVRAVSECGLLSRACQLLHGLQAERRLLPTALAGCLTAALSACLDTAQTLCDARGGTGEGRVPAQRWYREARGLAGLLASDDSGLRLYQVLAREDLAGLLAGVQRAQLRLLECQHAPEEVAWL